MRLDFQKLAISIAAVAIAALCAVAAVQVQRNGDALHARIVAVPPTAIAAIAQNAQDSTYNASQASYNLNLLVEENRPAVKSMVRDGQLASMRANRLLIGQYDEWFDERNVRSRRHALQVPDILSAQILDTLTLVQTFIKNTDSNVNGERGLIVATRDGVERLVKSGALSLDAATDLLADPHWQATLKFVAEASQNISVSTGVLAIESPAIAASLRGSAKNTEDISALVKAFLAEQNKYGKLILALRIVGALSPLASLR